ncbi:MAG: hypothetical protein CXR30_18155 [Geobacter sp.]|nr:MAG: hypothetical protein CXR30_18155 [Geobacter sp.]
MSLDQLIQNPDTDMNIGLVLLSDDWQVVGMNEHMRRIAGPAMGPMGQDLFLFHSPKSRVKVRGILLELSAPRNGMPNTMIIDFLGKVVMLSVSRLTLMSPDSTIAWAVTFLDMSEQTGAAMNPQSGHLELKKIPIYENGVFHFLSADQVYCIEADGNYCRIYTTLKKFYLLMSLKTVLQRFAQLGLFQVHKSFIVNLAHIRTIEQSSENRLTISFDDPDIPAVPVSRRLVPALKKRISSL